MRAIHHGIEVAVVPHVQDGGSADRQEQTAGQVEKQRQVQVAMGAHVACYASSKQQTGLQALN